MSHHIPHYIIKKIRFAHCKKGPDVCDECKALNVERICLLNLLPPNEGSIQRRLIQVNVGGDVIWRAFDVVWVFESPEKAQEYANENGIKDIEL